MTPDYQKLVSNFEEDECFQESESEQGSQKISDVDGLEKTRHLIEVIRDMLLNDEMADFEDYKNECSKYLSYLKASEEENKALIRRELIVCDDFTLRLIKIQKHVFLRYVVSKLLTIEAVSQIIEQTKAADDLCLIIRNLLLCCRILPPSCQERNYRGIGKLLEKIEVMKVHGKNVMNIEDFFPCLFDFDIVPVSYKIVSDEKVHRKLFSKTMKGFSDVIFESLVPWVNRMAPMKELLSKICDLCGSKKSTKRWSRFAEKILSDVVEKYIEDGPSSISRELKDVKKFIFEKSKIEYLCVLILALNAHNLKENMFLTVLKVLSQSYKDKSTQGIKLNLLLSLILKDIPLQFRTIETLPYVRLIQMNSPKIGKKVFRAVYDAFYEQREAYKRIYCPDICKGLRNDPEFWIGTLYYFISNESFDPPSGSDALSLYAPVRRILIESDETEDPDKAAWKYIVFARILLYTQKDCTNEWEIVLKNEKVLDNTELSRILTELKPVPVDLGLLERLLHALIFSGYKNSKRLSSLVRVYEKCGPSEQLALNLINSLRDVLYSSVYTREFWTFVLIIAETVQTTQVHERIIAFMAKYAKHGDLTCTFSFLKLIKLVSKANLCRSDIYIQNRQKILEIVRGSFNPYFGNRENEFVELSIILAILPEYKLYAHSSSLSSASFLLSQQQSENLNKTQIEEIKNTFNAIVDLNQHHCTLILLEFIEVFGRETFFADLRAYLISIARVRPHSPLSACAPRYILQEILNCRSLNQEIPRKIKSFLLNVENWYSNDEYTLYWVKREHLAVLKETQKLFFYASLDTDLINFAVELYFLDSAHDKSESDGFSVHVLAQLAK
jgi:hypothetical protein